MRLFAFTTGNNANKRMFRIVLAACLLLLGTLSACDALEGASRVEIGMVETTFLNRTEARFQTFSGRKAWQESLEAGDTLTLDYGATLDKGALMLQIENPQDEVIWEKELKEATQISDDEALVADSSGVYTIVVIGEGAGGRYQLAWDVVR